MDARGKFGEHESTKAREHERFSYEKTKTVVVRKLSLEAQ